MTITIETSVANAAVDAVAALIDVNGPGDLLFATAGSATLATVVCEATAFGAAAGGVATMAGLPKQVSIVADGECTQCWLRDGNGDTHVDSTVADSGADVNLGDASMVTGQLLNLTSYVLQLESGGNGSVLSTDARDAACAAACALLDAGASAGYVEICAGVTVLGTVTLDDPAMGAPTNGVASANNLPKENNAGASGTADNFKAYDSNGVLRWSGSAGDVGTEDCVLDDATVVSGQLIRIIAFTMNWPGTT